MMVDCPEKLKEMRPGFHPKSTVQICAGLSIIGVFGGPSKIDPCIVNECPRVISPMVANDTRRLSISTVNPTPDHCRTFPTQLYEEADLQIVPR